jgi:hypothetical protein
MPIARREEDSSPVIASPAGAKQSQEKRFRLPRRYAPRNGIGSSSFGTKPNKRIANKKAKDFSLAS